MRKFSGMIENKMLCLLLRRDKKSRALENRFEFLMPFNFIYNILQTDNQTHFVIIYNHQNN